MIYVTHSFQMSKKTKRYKWRTFNPGSTLWNVERTRAQKFKDSVRNILSSSNHSKYEENQDERPLNKRKKKRFSLPHWTVYFAWLCKFHVDLSFNLYSSCLYYILCLLVLYLPIVYQFLTFFTCFCNAKYSIWGTSWNKCISHQ